MKHAYDMDEAYMEDDITLQDLLKEVRYLRAKAERRLEELKEMIITYRALEELILASLMKGEAS